MNKSQKILDKVMSGKSDNSIRFNDFYNLLIDLGFELMRQKGSHIQLYNKQIGLFYNIQNEKGNAKDYQVKDIRKIIRQYNLQGE